MIRNLWSDITLYCGCHEQPVKLITHEGSDTFVSGGVRNSLFYSCPKYYPENRTEEERACFNRVDIGEIEILVNKLSSLIEENDSVNLAGFSFKTRKGTQFKVLRHTGKGIDVSVINRRITR